MCRPVRAVGALRQDVSEGLDGKRGRRVAQRHLRQWDGFRSRPAARAGQVHGDGVGEQPGGRDGPHLLRVVARPVGMTGGLEPVRSKFPKRRIQPCAGGLGDHRGFERPQVTLDAQPRPIVQLTGGSLNPLAAGAVLANRGGVVEDPPVGATTPTGARPRGRRQHQSPVQLDSLAAVEPAADPRALQICPGTPLGPGPSPQNTHACAKLWSFC